MSRPHQQLELARRQDAGLPQEAILESKEAVQAEGAEDALRTRFDQLWERCVGNFGALIDLELDRP